MARQPTIFESAFDVYTAERIIGEGGSGAVYLVINAAGDRFALKCLHAHLATTQRRKRFKNEIDFLRKGSGGTSIVTVVDSGLLLRKGTSTLFYVMPLFSGTLRGRMDRGISDKDALQAFSCVLDGVEAAHLLRERPRGHQIANSHSSLRIIQMWVVMLRLSGRRESEKLSNGAESYLSCAVSYTLAVTCLATADSR